MIEDATKCFLNPAIGFQFETFFSRRNSDQMYVSLTVLVGAESRTHFLPGLLPLVKTTFFNEGVQLYQI